jgi:uncharacterized protein YhfF
VGQKHVVLDGEGSPVAVIETVELRLLRYDEVDEEFAYDSGEDAELCRLGEQVTATTTSDRANSRQIC